MIRGLHFKAVLLLALFALPFEAFAQAPAARPHPTTNGFVGQFQPLPLPHLYWHFLLYQNHLDVKAVAAGAQNPAALALRNHMQARLGFSAADYAPIHTSATRLAGEIQSLDTQAATIKAGTPTAAAYSRLTALTAQRESDVSAEIAYLKQSLPSAKIKALEAFLVSYFSPKNAVPHPSTPPPQPVKKAVQP